MSEQVAPRGWTEETVYGLRDPHGDICTEYPQGIGRQSQPHCEVVRRTVWSSPWEADPTARKARQ